MHSFGRELHSGRNVAVFRNKTLEQSQQRQYQDKDIENEIWQTDQRIAVNITNAEKSEKVEFRKIKCNKKVMQEMRDNSVKNVFGIMEAYG